MTNQEAWEKEWIKWAKKEPPKEGIYEWVLTDSNRVMALRSLILRVEKVNALLKNMETVLDELRMDNPSLAKALLEKSLAAYRSEGGKK